jgi:hypothetical protein
MSAMWKDHWSNLLAKFRTGSMECTNINLESKRQCFTLKKLLRF